MQHKLMPVIRGSEDTHGWVYCMSIPWMAGKVDNILLTLSLLVTLVLPLMPTYANTVSLRILILPIKAGREIYLCGHTYSRSWPYYMLQVEL